jgi:hypothetical protein
MSKNSWKMLCEEIFYNLKRGVHAGAIGKAQNAILSVVTQLEEMGEIIVARKSNEPFNSEEFKKSMAQFWADLSRKEEGLEFWKKDVFDKLDKS